MTFRDATLDDLPKIVEIYNSTVASRLVTADLEPVSVESKIDWFNEHHSETRPLWIVEDAQKNTIGWVSFQDDRLIIKRRKSVFILMKISEAKVTVNKF